MISKAISPLRQRMIDDMTMRRMALHTQQGYIRAVKRFADFFGRSADKATVEDIRRFHVHLAKTMGRIPTMNATMTALKFFFGVTLGRRDVVDGIPFAREPRKLPVVLSTDEVARLLAAAANIKYRHADGSPTASRPSSAVQCDRRSAVAAAIDSTGLAPQSGGLFVATSRRNSSP
jgi:integrase/recombinase XerD